MKILMVNNRLKVFGGEGTYMTSVGDYFKSVGHDVQYFGLEDPEHLHGNVYGLYAKKSKNPFKLFKSKHNAKKFSEILDSFQPDIIHLNLIYFTLTPYILTEAQKRNIPVIQTVHDGKIVCPSYQLFISNKTKACDECVDHNFKRCLKNKCVKESFLLSYLAYKESLYNEKHHYYDLIDSFVFPSKYMMGLHIKYGIDLAKCFYLQNFSRLHKISALADKENYVLFFGRIEKIKGVEVLLQVIKENPTINFVVAGDGDLKSLFDNIPNCKNLGFVTKEPLQELIKKAKVCVFPSIWNENCPMGVAESIALGTPVICSNIGGMPELMKDGFNGFLVKPNDPKDLKAKIELILDDKNDKMAQNCLNSDSLLGIEKYCEQLMKHYESIIETKRSVKND